MRALPNLPPDVPDLERLESLLCALEPDATPRWGVMGPAAMVAHCVAFADLCLGRVPVSWPLRCVARLLGPWFVRRLVSRSVQQAPRGMTTLRQLRTDGGGVDLAAAQAELSERWRALQALPAEHRHPLYGRMRSQDVRALVRHHTAHHANQFGLLGAR